MLDEPLLSHLNDVFNKCLHCGLCLPSCPTYNISWNEESSPRGRIQLMLSVENHAIGMSKRFVDEIYSCLDCQACETACPAGVRFGELIETVRDDIGRSGKDMVILWLAKKLFLRGILSSPFRTRIFGKILKYYESSGLRDAFEQSGILKLFSARLHEQQRLLPRADATFLSGDSGELIPSKSPEHRGTVAFLSGCIMNVSFAGIHRDAIRVLNINGYDVIVPKKQGCCGSLHAHFGDLDEAKRLAKINIGVFGQYEYGTLVVDSAGCSAFMKEYSKLFSGDAEMADQARSFSSKVREISEFISEVGLSEQPGVYAASVTYHDACHLVHTQKISRQPRELLERIPGLKMTELNESTWCCGSAGIHNMVKYEDSMKILDRKIENIRSTGAQIVATSNPGCHLQLQHGLRRNNIEVEVLHPVTVLSRSYPESLDR